MSKEKIVLSVGDPDVEAPSYVFDAAIEKMKAGGMDPLRFPDRQTQSIQRRSSRLLQKIRRSNLP